MSPLDRARADYEGTSMTTGVHPVGFLRLELSGAGVLRASEIPGLSDGQWVKVAGIVTVRQRPGTAKGFFFLTLEDETGFANVVVTPQRYEEHRLVLVTAAAMLVEGFLQNRDGVSTIKGVRFSELGSAGVPAVSHDFR